MHVSCQHDHSIWEIRVEARSVASGPAVGPVYPMPRSAVIRAFVATAGQRGTAGLSDSTLAVAASEGTRLVYENTLSRAFIGPPSNLPLAQLADDIATTAAFGCHLDRYVVRVTGDLNGDNTVVGDLRVTTALYDACPRSNVQPNPQVPPVAGTQCVFDIPAAQAGGIIDLTCLADPFVVPTLRNNIWLGVSFSTPGGGTRQDAGVAIGAPALKGFSLDQFDHPSAACGAGDLGEFEHIYAGFFAQIYVREPCDNSFLAYKSTRQSERGYSPGANIHFADDIHLPINNCNMVAYEVSVKGTTGAVYLDLRSSLSAADPANGGVIPGTRQIVVFDQRNRVFVARVVPASPILLPQDLYVGFRTSSVQVGPIATGKVAGPGTTEDFHLVYSTGQQAWVPTQFSSPTAWDAFDVVIICDGSPPVGACCDMYLLENYRCVGGPDDGAPCTSDSDCSTVRCIGDSVCREVPEMNCATHFIGPDFQPQWVEGGTCDSDPFPHSCGKANLTQAECASLVAPGDPFSWRLGDYCESQSFTCPFYACLSSEGQCNLARHEPGCANLDCCTYVCQEDPWCCRVEWDRHCVETSVQIPYCQGAHNDACRSSLGTPEVGANSSTFFTNVFATGGETDPPFCCVWDIPNADGYGTVWFKFVATHESASIRTCLSDPLGDSMVQVFSVGDPTSDETACNSLTMIGCGDDEQGCGYAVRHAKVCVDGLIPGGVYYVMVASKTEEAKGLHQLDIVSPCQLEVPFSTADCNSNGLPDGCDLRSGTSGDRNGNHLPDECDALQVADYDRDGDADLRDIAAFQTCFTGSSGVPIAPLCETFDSQPSNALIGLEDFWWLLLALSGPHP